MMQMSVIWVATRQVWHRCHTCCYFWEGADQHQLAIQRCDSCGLRRHPPVPMCAICGSLKARYEAVSGRGRVISAILSRHPNASDETPLVIVLVELEEGVRLVSNLLDGGRPPFED